MARKFLPCIMFVPVLLTAWLMFTAPVVSSVAPDQLVAYDYPSEEEQAAVADEFEQVYEVVEKSQPIESVKGSES